MTMGLSPMKPQDWIEIDAEYEADIAERRQLLSSHRHVVLQSTPQAEEANRELLDCLVNFLPQQFPDRFRQIDRKITNLATGDVWDLDDLSLDSLEVSSMLVQEDLCLMLKDEKGSLKFVSGAVLFPQRWSLIEKLGMDMERIHQPVPLYEDSISRPVNSFMERLQPSKPFSRCNWTINDNYTKFQPLDEHDQDKYIQLRNSRGHIEESSPEPITAENVGERLCTRMERETLSRLPKTGAILFTIRTHIKPLSRFADQPEKARQLAKALRSLDPSFAEYKAISSFKDAALSFLDQAASKE